MKRCVVCGSKKQKRITKHHIVPQAFVRVMPPEVKKKIVGESNLVNLCRKCHDFYENHALEKNRKFSSEVGVPVEGIESKELKEEKKIYCMAKFLLHRPYGMSEEKVELFKKEVLKHLGKDRITREDLVGVCNVNFRKHPGFTPFHEVAVTKIEDFDAFAESWREHFFETMKPKFIEENCNA